MQDTSLNISSINLERTTIKEDDIQIIAQCHNLQYIYLSSTKTVDGLKYLGEGCPELRELEIGLPGIDAETIKALAQGCHKIRRIILGYSGINDEALQYLADGCPDLEILEMGNCSITDMGVKHLAAEKCHKIKKLDLVKNETAVSDVGLKYLSEGCHEIQHLLVNNCSVTDVGLKYLSEGCHEIRMFYLTDTKVTDEGMKYLRLGCPKLSGIFLAILQMQECFS